MIALLASSAVHAADKGDYTLLNPTPRDQMRPMATDRPDVTESPITVDAGHVQLEMSFAEHTWDGDARVLDVAPFNLKLGLLNNVDLQFVATPYERISESGEHAEGFADSTALRLKINLWGNDGAPEPGQTAFAVMPFVKIPSGVSELNNDHWEGGLILPLAIELPNDFLLGLMAKVDVAYAGEGDYGVAFVHTATLGHEIPGVPQLSGFIEYVGVSPLDLEETYQALASTGLTYDLSDDCILDAGARFGLSDAADDVTVFVGLSVRY